jgi:host factor-I protein
MATPTDFDAGLPTIRQVQILIRDQMGVEIKLVTGDVFGGSVLWQDTHAICISSEGKNLILMRSAIAYIKS